MSPQKLEEVIIKLSVGVPGLAEELRGKLGSPEVFEASLARSPLKAARVVLDDLDDEEGVALERVIAKTVGARPVAKVCKDEVTTEFIGPDSGAWADAIKSAKPVIDHRLPAVGLIEIADGDFPIAGTGWLIASDIVVTNRHVATVFARRGPAPYRGVFRSGLVSGQMSVRIDFMEEECHSGNADFPITDVLWIAPPGEADVAFLRVVAPAGGKLPECIPLAETDPGTDVVIVAIGYPSRDPDIPDQDLVLGIFGDGVYDKKRAAPGRVLGVQGPTLRHDCSTLGGNSGSVLLDMKTGYAVGLHRAGLLDDSANLAVSASHLRELLKQVMSLDSDAESVARSLPVTSTAAPSPTGAPAVWEVRLPFEIVIGIRPIGVPVSGTASVTFAPPHPPAGPSPAEPGINMAVGLAAERFGDDPNVLNIRAGYRFRRGWITDERVVVFEVREKLGLGELMDADLPAFPRSIGGFAVDVRTGAQPLQLADMGIDLDEVLERVARPGLYKEPRGYENPASKYHMARVREKMNATFHVSPEAGFKNLGPFLLRTEKRLTATMYEWEAKNHISDTIEQAVKGRALPLKMITQKRGVAEAEATEAAVRDMQERLGAQFEHVWASVRGSSKLFPTSYHIKVVVRDGEEFWLSSGNWKNSGQPSTPGNVVGPGSNREWHVIVQNKRLAALFEAYIEHDFRQTLRYPLEEDEGTVVPDMTLEFFVPDIWSGVAVERPRQRRYEPELVILDEELDIQPLLTPDRDADLNPLFLGVATEMVRRATSSVCIQNQAFKLTKKNNAEFDEFFQAVKEKQEEIRNVRIIMRDAREFGRPKDAIAQQELIERLKAFGIDTSPDRLRLQTGCHTKGIIIDSKEVLLGSHNFTNEGALYNRDASLLVRSPKVAKFFERIFLFDWDNFAHNDASELIGGMRRAMPGEPTPEGFRKVSLAELLGDS